MQPKFIIFIFIFLFTTYNAKKVTLNNNINNQLGAITVDAGSTFLEKGNLKLIYSLYPPHELIKLLCELQQKLAKIGLTLTYREHDKRSNNTIICTIR